MALNYAGAILAAGTGERLRKAAGGLPKPLVEIGGRTLLARQADAIIDAGADRILAVVSSETAAIIAQRRVQLPATLELFVRDTANSMETLFTIGEKLAEDRFLLATVDALVPRSQFRHFAARAFELTASKALGPLDGALGLVRWRGDRRPLFAEVGSDGLITGLGDRQTSLVTAGLYMFSAGIFRFVDQARAAKLSAMRQFLAHLVRSGIRLGAIELAGAIDVDEVDDLEAARAMLAEEHDGTGVSAGRR
jgi:UDP-N-acetylglucosamine diphosphorylase / glucose-1-phosphate thymidylyltransferase / UDP-N-acetylgalactosamine diphosphorylase / glucosamine-1-phosphate N-acetyltransferase / galactosamine-1-phosphate N-acetyltransferase